MNTALITVIGLLLAGMLFIGWWTSRKQTSSDDFFIGGRKFGVFISSATQIAATFGGGVMLAQVGIGYRWGFAVMVYSSIAAPLRDSVLWSALDVSAGAREILRPFPIGAP